ncbi:hypothetical protein AMK31_35240 [Streptomyces sp. TSRI0107]|nr:hypothetical protein AMK31_35240 [Streptomyces sp. TSRI0107]
MSLSRDRARSEDSTSPQLLQVGQVDSGQGVEQVGLGGTDVCRSLGAGAQSSAGCHEGIVRAAHPQCLFLRPT